MCVCAVSVGVVEKHHFQRSMPTSIVALTFLSLQFTTRSSYSSQSGQSGKTRTKKS